MRLAILWLILTQTDSVGEYVKSNYDIVVREGNLIGGGCASKVYGLRFDGKSLALKEYHDAKEVHKGGCISGAFHA